MQIKSVSRDDIYYQEVNAVPTQSFEVVYNQPTRLEAGDTVDIEDASGTIKLAGVRILNVRKSYPNPGEDTITHSETRPRSSLEMCLSTDTSSDSQSSREDGSEPSQQSTKREPMCKWESPPRRPG